MKRALGVLFTGVQVSVVAGAWFWFQTRHPAGDLLAGDTAGRLLAWGRLAGLLAAVLILFLFVLVSRSRTADRIGGFDRLARFHHTLGFSLVALLVLHPALITLGYARQANVNGLVQLTDFWMNWRGLAVATDGTALMAMALLVSTPLFRSRLKYEEWLFSHLFLYGAFVLIFPHQVIAGNDFANHPVFRWYWYTLNVGALTLLACGRAVRPWRLLRRHRFAVERIETETEDAVSVHIDGRDLSAFRAEAGQFVIVRFLADGFRWQAHPFSLSRAPNGKSLRLTIKRLGDFTRRVPELKPGTPVLIDGPHGRLTLRACQSKKLLLIAGGIGITPLRALVEEVVLSDRDALLIYANRTAGEIVFRDELDVLATASGGRLRVIHVLSNDPAWTGERGRVDHARLSRLVPDIHERDAVLCGPPAMMASVASALKKLGVPSSRIHSERFAF